MSFDLYLHASEDQTRKIPRDRVDEVMTAVDGLEAAGKREYRFTGEGFTIEFEVETETAHGGDVKGVYVHASEGEGAFVKAKELSLHLVDSMELVIYDHQSGEYVSRETFAEKPVPEDGVMFRAETGRPVAAEPREASSEASRAPQAASQPAPSGGCAGIVLVGLSLTAASLWLF